jgi:hypothetical protein
MLIFFSFSNSSATYTHKDKGVSNCHSDNNDDDDDDDDGVEGDDDDKENDANNDNVQQ